MAEPDQTSRRLRFVLHGERIRWPKFRKAVRELRDDGLEVDVRVTWEEGHARHFAAEAARDGMDAVIAVGGDGTLHEVANGLCDAGVGAPGKRGDDGPSTALGLIAAGTANDFARLVGLQKDAIYPSLEPVLRDERRTLDLVRVTIDNHEPRRLINVATAGIGAEATSDAAPATKKILGNLAYLLSGLTHAGELEAETVEVEGSGGYSWSGSAYGVAVGNGRMAGGGAWICPDARLDDGLLDLVICPEIPLGDLLPLVGDTFRHADFRRDERIEYHQLSAVTLRFEDDIALNLDGEPVRGKIFRFEVEPGRIEAHLPASAPVR